MKIQVNKHYINAKGEVIFIVECIEELLYPFRDAKNYEYLDTGKYVDNYVNSKRDLICECTPDILAYYTANFITQKEFIQQHIDYWSKHESIIN